MPGLIVNAKPPLQRRQVGKALGRPASQSDGHDDAGVQMMAASVCLVGRGIDAVEQPPLGAGARCIDGPARVAGRSSHLSARSVPQNVSPEATLQTRPGKERQSMHVKTRQEQVAIRRRAVIEATRPAHSAAEHPLLRLQRQVGIKP